MQTTPSILLSGLLLVLPAAHTSAQAAVHVVDQLGGPGSQYTSIADAVAASADGDVILVRPGGYQPFVVDGKGLAIVADAPPPAAAPVLLHTAFDHPTVRNLSSGQSVVLRGFTMSASLGTAVELEVRDCVGPVLIEDVHLSGGGPCLSVQGSSAVVLARSALHGQVSLAGGSFGPGIAVEATGANLYLYDCEIAGGAGHDGFFPEPPDEGQDALRLESGLLFASGTVIAGGAGGDGADLFLGACSGGADGGDGLVLGAGAPAAYTLDCALQGGAGGAGHSICLPGSGGYPVLVQSGAHAQLPGTHGMLLSTSPLREGDSSALELWGPGGRLVLLLASPAAEVVFLLAPAGAVVPAVSSAFAVVLGTTNPAGYLMFPFTVGQLPPGAAAAELYLQPAFLDLAAGGAALGAPAHVLELDQSF
jgi:hypothetical protein